MTMKIIKTVAEYKARTTKPQKGNKYYTTMGAGGFSPCIVGSPQDSDCNVLANCVGYAVGRFNEIGEQDGCKYLRSINAENMANVAKQQGLEVSDKPTLGACVVWAKGQVGNSNDGAGHVAIVEQINPDGSIVTSESGYGCKNPFWTTTRKAGGNWGAGNDYKFIGFIKNPAVQIGETAEPAKPETPETPEDDTPVCTLSKGCKGEGVVWMQKRLYAAGYLRSNEVDGDFGKITLGALLAFQFENGLEVDGVCGAKTKAKLKE